MDSKVVLISMEGPSPESIQRWIRTMRDYECDIAIPVQEEDDNVASGDCKQDHGERTNYKLRDQPFYMRGRHGKMRGY